MNICHLPSATCDILCTGFILGWRLSTERVAAQPLYLLLFAPGVIAIGGLQVVL